MQGRKGFLGNEGRGMQNVETPLSKVGGDCPIFARLALAWDSALLVAMKIEVANEAATGR